MAGNTRGKLKEHFEGIHRNFDWCLHHCQTSLALIGEQVKGTSSELDEHSTEEQVLQVVSKHPLFQGIKSLGEGIQVLDDLAMQIYAKL